MGAQALPRWVRVAAMPNHVWLALVAMLCVTLVYVIRGQLPAELIGVVTTLVGISAGGNALVRAADNMEPDKPQSPPDRGK